jgi:hypothetical protein
MYVWVYIYIIYIYAKIFVYINGNIYTCQPQSRTPHGPPLADAGMAGDVKSSGWLSPKIETFNPSPQILESGVAPLFEAGGAPSRGGASPPTPTPNLIPPSPKPESLIPESDGDSERIRANSPTLDSQLKPQQFKTKKPA